MKSAEWLFSFFRNYTLWRVTSLRPVKQAFAIYLYELQTLKWHHIIVECYSCVHWLLFSSLQSHQLFKMIVMRNGKDTQKHRRKKNNSLTIIYLWSYMINLRNKQTKMCCQREYIKHYGVAFFFVFDDEIATSS